MSEKRITEESRYAGLALAEEELVARVAWCYYHDGLTQNDIGERLGLPRLKISRLLEKGRQSGVIRVQINSRYEGCLALETELQQRFGLKIARVLPALNTPPMNTRLGIGAAQSLMGVLEPGQLLAVGFGEATMSCLQHLSGFIGSQQVRLVTLSGGVGPYMTGIGQLDAACSVSMIPAPLRVSSADVAEILRRESSVRDVSMKLRCWRSFISALWPSPTRCRFLATRPLLSCWRNSKPTDCVSKSDAVSEGFCRLLPGDVLG